MDLVTVTCWRDHRQMFLQAESIKKFLKPCRHWVIINDLPDVLKKTESVWRKHLPIFYKNHDLKILVPEWDCSEYLTYHRQQVLKFWISKYIDDDFLILDSKNFFIKNCSTDEWSGISGCGLIQDYEVDKLWFKCSKVYSEYLGQEVLKKAYAVQTPFVFRKKTLEKLGDIEKFCSEWKNLHHNKKIIFSEFLFYSYLEREAFENFEDTPKNLTIWPASRENLKDLSNLITDEKILSIGLHREVLNNCTAQEKQIISDFLKKIGLTNRIV